MEGTRSLLQLALGCRNLRSVVHTSSAYVNLHFPHSSFVQEAIYPLMHDGMEVEAEELVQVRMHLVQLQKPFIKKGKVAVLLRKG